MNNPMGKTDEAKALFLKNVESIELCKDPNQPVFKEA